MCGRGAWRFGRFGRFGSDGRVVVIFGIEGRLGRGETEFEHFGDFPEGHLVPVFKVSKREFLKFEFRPVMPTHSRARPK